MSRFMKFNVVVASLASVLAVSAAAQAHPNDFVVPSGPAMVMASSGQLGWHSPRVNGKFYQVHRVYMDPRHTYTIDMVSPQFDTFLSIQDPMGRVVRQNDDGGRGLNSRVFFRPARAGFYSVVATSCEPGATGGYTVRVQQGSGFGPHPHHSGFAGRR